METAQERSISFFRFEDLRVYGKATDYCTWVIKNLGTPGNDAERNLVNSFCHSSYDIALNIAEGSSRNKSQFEHNLKISKTAIRECIMYSTVALNLGLFDETRCEQSREFLMEMTRMIGALIISLQRTSSRHHDEADVDDNADDSNPAEIDLNF